MSQSIGVFCLSVDDPTRLNAACPETAHRRHDVIALLQRFHIRSNWTVAGHEWTDVPGNAERTVKIPEANSRRQVRAHLTRAYTAAAGSGEVLNSAVIGRHEVRERWDILVKLGCTVTRPRAAEHNVDPHTRMLRGGLWFVPIAFSFSGSPVRSVGALARSCQQRLEASVRQRTVFHLHIDVSHPRRGWQKECAALEKVFALVRQQSQQGLLYNAHFSEIPAQCSNRTAHPLRSILRAA